MTIGLIGLGSIGSRHLRNLQELFPAARIEVLTKRRSSEEAGARVRLISSEQAFYTTHHDVYVISNETHKHVETILKCLAQKPRGIFVEKPLSHDLAELTRIQKEVKKHGCVFVVGYSMQFFKPYLEIKKLLTKGVVGKPQSIRISVGQDLRTWRAKDYRMTYSAGAQSGGVVLDLIHELNIGGWLLDEPLSLITGVSGKLSTLEIQAEDTAESLLVSPSRVLVSVHQDYLQVPGRRSCEVFGTKGTLTWSWTLSDPDAEHRILVSGLTRTRTHAFSEKRGEMYKREMKEFIRHTRLRDGYSNIAEAIRDMHTALIVREARIL